MYAKICKMSGSETEKKSFASRILPCDKSFKKSAVARQKTKRNEIFYIYTREQTTTITSLN